MIDRQRSRNKKMYQMTIVYQKTGAVVIECWRYWPGKPGFEKNTYHRQRIGSRLTKWRQWLVRRGFFKVYEYYAD